MDTLRIVQFDVRGVNPVNKIDGEVIKIKDKTCPWVIPDGSPFFGDYPKAGELPLTVVYDDRGAELVRDRDYWLEEEFMPLVEVSGRPIVCFIRLSDELLERTAFITVNYRSIGAYFIPRNSIEEWLEKMHRGSVPVPFSKVLGVPPTLPSEWHSHSIKTEIGDWFELTWFYTYLANIISTRDPTIADQLNAAIRQAFDQLYALRDSTNANLRAHDKNYNVPHGTDKAAVNLGNHDNYRTATLAEQIAGTSATLLSTPQGVQEVLKSYIPDTKQAMRSGILPLSKFSNSGYIPPAITGSFEGLGSRSECMGMCVEESGRVVTIQNHYDGRNEGLYFSILSDYKNAYNPAKPYDYNYTVYKYEPPVLTNVGVTPNAIVMGSGNDVIMVGQTTLGNPAANDRWFIALTNNSFDPSGHRYIQTNMAPIWAQVGNPDANGYWPGNGYTKYYQRLTVQLLDDWIVLTVDSQPTNGQNGRMSYWRIPRSAIINGTPATWELIRISYQDYDFTQFNNMPYWEYAQKQVSGGLMNRWGRYTFNSLNVPSGVGYFGRRMMQLFAKKSGVANVYYLNMLMYTFLEYTPPGQAYNDYATMTNMVYEFNVVTGAMTLIYRQPALEVNQAAYNQAVNIDRDAYMEWYYALVGYVAPATMTLFNGETLTCNTGEGQESSVLNSLVIWRKFKNAQTGAAINTREDFVRLPMSNAHITRIGFAPRYRSVRTPAPIGISSRWTAYETQGENFMTFPAMVKNPAVGYQYPRVIARNVSGAYAVRPQVPNAQYGPVYSRPLVNAAYETNMTAREGVVSLTGSAAELDARGIEAGTMGLSACGWSAKDFEVATPRVWPSPAFNAPDQTGALQTFPRTYNRVFDAGAQQINYVPTTFYGYTQAVQNKIRSLIPGAKQGAWWCYSLFMLNAETGGMFSGLDTAVLHVNYPSQANGNISTWDAQVFYIRPIIEAPNASHPGCYMITDFQILGSSVAFIQQVAVRFDTQGAATSVYNRGQLTAYRNGNTLSCAMYNGFRMIGGSIYVGHCAFDITLSNGVVNNLVAEMLGWEQGDLFTYLPRVGPTRMTRLAPDTYNAKMTAMTTDEIANRASGGASKMFAVDKAGGAVDYYSVINAYPETGWVIFFLEEVETLVNGTKHRMPTGTVDLRDFDPDPRNKTYWIYATMEDQKGRYIISSTRLRQSGKMIHAATVTTGENQILLIDRRQPFLIGDLELSYSRKGGIIPVSSGFPQDTGNFTFLRAAELLP